MKKKKKKKKTVMGFAHRLAAMVSILLGRTDQYRTAWNQSAHKQNQAAVDRLSPVPARPSRAQHSKICSCIMALFTMHC